MKSLSKPSRRKNLQVQKTPDLSAAYDLRLLCYVKMIARHLHLSDWDIRIDETTSEEGSYADIHCVEGRRVAIIRIGDGFALCSPESQRHTVVHELVHIHLWQVMQAPVVLSGLVGEGVWAVFVGNFTAASEYAVDGIADSIAPLLPTMDDMDE